MLRSQTAIRGLEAYNTDPVTLSDCYYSCSMVSIGNIHAPRRSRRDKRTKLVDKLHRQKPGTRHNSNPSAIGLVGNHVDWPSPGILQLWSFWTTLHVVGYGVHGDV